MLRPDTFALTALLALLTAIGPLSMDLYLPALPAISAALNATPAAGALTISFYLVGFAAGQVAYGPLSDRHGRKPVMFAAMLIYCVATVACALAPTIEALIAARALQAFGSSGAIVLSRAVVRDLYEGPRAGRELSLMAVIMGLAPIVAPVIGSLLQAAFGWRACFYFLVLAGIAAAAAVRWLLPETLRKREHVPSSGLLASIGVVARSRATLAYIGMIAGGYGGLFAFIAGSPFALQTVYALDPFGYAVAFAIASAGYIGGSWLAARLVTRLGIDRTIGWGVLCFAVAGAAMIAATALAPRSVAGFVAPMTLYLFGLGLAMPQALAGALQPFPERAGAASSLIGCVQQSVAASTGALVAHALGDTAWPLVIGIALPGTAALAIWAATRGVRGRAGSERRRPQMIPPGTTLITELMRQVVRVGAGTAVYVAIVVLAAPLPAAAGLMLTFPALNGLGFFFSEDVRAAAMARSMLWMPVINGVLCAGYILSFEVLARTGAAALAAWALLLVVVLLWYASVTRRRVRAGIATERQLAYALMVTLAGVALAVVAGAASTRPESGLTALPGADDAQWIAETIWRSRLKIGLFAVALAVFLPAIAYLPISDSTRGILTGLPIVPFGGLVAIAGDAGMSVDVRIAVIAGMLHGVWLAPAVAVWFILGFSRFLEARAKMSSPEADAAIRFGALAAGWLAAFAVIVVAGYAIEALAAGYLTTSSR